MSKLKPKKAKEMLKHGSVRGHKLSAKQKRMFKAVAAGWKPDNPFRKLRSA